MHDYPSHKFPQTKVPPSACESHSLMAWLWLFTIQGQAKAVMEPPFWPSLAWPIWAWLGLAHSLRPGHAQHYPKQMGKQSEWIVFKGLVQSNFWLPNRATSNCNWFRTDPNIGGLQPEPLGLVLMGSWTEKQTGSDWSFVIKFIVPNNQYVSQHMTITSYILCSWIEIVIIHRLIQHLSNFIKIWLRYDQNWKDMHSSCSL